MHEPDWIRLVSFDYIYSAILHCIALARWNLSAPCGARQWICDLEVGTRAYDTRTARWCGCSWFFSATTIDHYTATIDDSRVCQHSIVSVSRNFVLVHWRFPCIRSRLHPVGHPGRAFICHSSHGLPRGPYMGSEEVRVDKKLEWTRIYASDGGPR